MRARVGSLGIAAALVAVCRADAWCGERAVADWAAALPTAPGAGLIVLGPGAGRSDAAAALARTLRDAFQGVLVVAADADVSEDLTSICVGARAHCFRDGREGQALRALAPRSVATVASLDGWDFSRESATAHVAPRRVGTRPSIGVFFVRVARAWS